jgi:hypothetical protein
MQSTHEHMERLVIPAIGENEQNGLAHRASSPSRRGPAFEKRQSTKSGGR